MIEKTIDAPHPDIELAQPRRPIRYRVVLPEAGCGPHTGLIFYIHGYGGSYNEPYAERLMPSLAALHDCVVVAVDYQGAALLSGEDNGMVYPPPDLVQQVLAKHGVLIDDPRAHANLEIFCRALVAHGITTLDLSIEFTRVTDHPELFNFGLLPALDHLQVLHGVLAEYPIDKRRLYVLGTSYGGYIGGLLLKLAPHSFRMILDNSGFVSAKDSVANLLGRGAGSYFGVRVQVGIKPAWTLDPKSPLCFRPSHDSIRDMLAPGHLPATRTAVYAYLSATDNLVPVARKLALANSCLGRLPFDLRIVREADLDGRLFKTMEHGMRASLRGLFGQAMERYLASGVEPEDGTDFDRGTALDLPCHEATYRIRFSPEGDRKERG